MYKKHDLVMLATNQKESLIYCNSLLNKLSYSELSPANCSHYHLYILSDDEIKEGDWFIHPDSSCFDKECKEVSTGGYEIKQVSKVDKHFVYHEVMAISKSRNIKKIIATTNTSIKVKSNKNLLKEYITIDENLNGVSLPQIPISFIQYFIEKYNKGNVITKVNVEYVIWTQDIKTNKFSLFINPFNCINIKTVKDSYSRDEVIAFAKAYAEAVWNIRHDNGSAFFDTLERKWIEQNL